MTRMSLKRSDWLVCVKLYSFRFKDIWCLLKRFTPRHKLRKTEFETELSLATVNYYSTDNGRSFRSILQFRPSDKEFVKFVWSQMSKWKMRDRPSAFNSISKTRFEWHDSIVFDCVEAAEREVETNLSPENHWNYIGNTKANFTLLITLLMENVFAFHVNLKKGLPNICIGEYEWWVSSYLFSTIFIALQRKTNSHFSVQTHPILVFRSVIALFLVWTHQCWHIVHRQWTMSLPSDWTAHLMADTSTRLARKVGVFHELNYQYAKYKCSVSMVWSTT